MRLSIIFAKQRISTNIPEFIHQIVIGPSSEEILIVYHLNMVCFSFYVVNEIDIFEYFFVLDA